MAMNLGSDLVGRLRNTNLPVNKCMFPIFEAVVNSILSIDDRIALHNDLSKEEDYIDVTIRRDTQTSLDEGKKASIQKIVIEDNGIGFDTENFKSFLTMDSQYRAERGCKGIGRLLWLKAFEGATIESTYIEEGKVYTRNFQFNENGIEFEEVVEQPESARILTRVTLHTIRKTFRKELQKKTANSMAKALLEHCLWFFLRSGGAPRIRIIDGSDVVCLDELYDNYLTNREETPFIVNGVEFRALHVWSHISDTACRVSYCANERVVTEEKITGVAGLFETQLKHGDEMLYYTCYVTSKYLDEHVTSNRTAFDIPEQPETGQTDVFEDTIYFNTIREKLRETLREYLKQDLKANIQENRKKVELYVEQKAPYYRPILRTMQDEEITISPNSPDKSIELMLHDKMVANEHKIIEEGHDIMQVREGETEDEYRKRTAQFFSEAISLKEAALARYVVNRKIFIELLRAAVRKGEDGKYIKEEEIHNIIMPMHSESDQGQFVDNNLWIIDERLVFHSYLASDRPIKSMRITDSESLRRPDILVENSIYDNPMFIATSGKMPYTSLRIIEFKRPMRDDFSDKTNNNPIKQCIEYVKEIRNGKKQTKDGRQLIGASEIAYCYIICDLTESMREMCTDAQLWETYDRLGYIGYHSTHKIYFEVISYDQLLNAAEERNTALFEKLGLSHN